MNIITKKENTTLTVALEGRLDTTTAPELEKALQAADASVTELILDFAGLAYVSSAGLRVLLTTQKKMNKQGKMIIRNVCDDIKEIFEITGFLDILTIESKKTIPAKRFAMSMFGGNFMMGLSSV